MEMINDDKPDTITSDDLDQYDTKFVTDREIICDKEHGLSHSWTAPRIKRVVKNINDIPREINEGF
jgi:hypothetical protein